MPFSSRLTKAQLWAKNAFAKLQATGEFTIRESQETLTQAIIQSLIFKTPLVAEAPTGTGKSLAYLIGALAVNLSGDSSSTSVPIVVATATKALQSQLATSDIPILVNAGLLNESHVCIAKGRSNYICLSEAARIKDTLDSLHLGESFLEESDFEVDLLQLLDMLSDYDSNKWNGDFDSWLESKPQGVKSLTISREFCPQRKCVYYDKCAFYRNRREMENSKLIITNHHLVLKDLELSVEEDGLGIFPMVQYPIVFDEAHHLPDSALSIAQRQLSISFMLALRPRVIGAASLIQEHDHIHNLALALGVSTADIINEPMFQELTNLKTILSSIPVHPDTHEHRFANNKVPAPMLRSLDTLNRLIQMGMTKWSRIREQNQEMLQRGNLQPSELAASEELSRRFREIIYAGNQALECIKLFQGELPTAKWISRESDSLVIHSALIEGSDILTSILWKNPRVEVAVLTSATLQDAAGFARFKARSGYPAHTQELAVPGVFDYSKSQLVVAGMKSSPARAEREAYEVELLKKLPTYIKPNKSSLVLATSWRLVRLLVSELRAQFGEDSVLVQGEKNLKALRQEVAARVSQGKTAILIGTSSLSEGLDLPGDLCSHVLITSIPFTVPSTPVEQEAAERLGRNYFSKRSLPDATYSMIQMAGRLIRRESDSGAITIFDRRLVSMSYGGHILKSLPPFQLVIEKT